MVRRGCSPTPNHKAADQEAVYYHAHSPSPADEPVLDAAHVQPYLGPKSNHIQNGLLLTKEFHALFDAGLITITPELRVRVSPRIRERWNNGRRFYEFDGKPLASVPPGASGRPSALALEWHNRRNRKLFVA